MAAVNFPLHDSPFCKFRTVNAKQFGAAVLTKEGEFGNKHSSWNGADAAFLDGLFSPTKTTLERQKSDGTSNSMLSAMMEISFNSLKISGANSCSRFSWGSGTEPLHFAQTGTTGSLYSFGSNTWGHLLGSSNHPPGNITVSHALDLSVADAGTDDFFQ